MGKVSIIISNYNYALYISRAIESAIAQTYKNLEVIVIDDGSTDTSRDIIKTYSSHIKYSFKENGGQASAFNTGFSMSTGEYILFLDADDFLYENAIANSVNQMSYDTSKVHFYLETVNSLGEQLDGRMPNEKLSEGNLIFQLQQKGFYPSPPTTGNLWHRSFLSKVFPIPENDWRICADTYLISLAPILGLIKVVNQPLGAYRIHSQNNWTRPDFSIDKVRKLIIMNQKKDDLIEFYMKKENLTYVRPESAHDLMYRLISIQTDYISHPIPQDTKKSVFVKGIIATFRERTSVFKKIYRFLYFILNYLFKPYFLTHFNNLFFLPRVDNA